MQARHKLFFPSTGKLSNFLRRQVPWPYPADGAHSYYRNFALPADEAGRRMALESFGERADPEQLIGSIGLFRGEQNNRGFWIGLPWQRIGFATEASEAVIDFWFDVLNFERLRIPKAIANTGSRRNLESS